MDLREKIIVITGGSQGFGKELAKAFSGEGAKVIITSHEKEHVEATAKELAIDGFVADVTILQDMEKVAKYVVEKYGKIDFWINNAGIQIAPSLFEEIDIKRLHDLFDVNFFGYFYGCKVAIPVMKKQGQGVILNINSTAGLEGKPDISAYSSSKFAVKGMTEAIRKENQNTGIQVLGIFPGGMQTEIYKEKYPESFNDYMKVDYAVEKVITNLKSENPELDLIIKRPGK
jgi:NAD(P)-dependent dehydrogenase (short-subunit alcohol dehydrogenase family)